MAGPRSRLDGYGAPLPEITDARQQSLRTSATNQGQLAWLWTLLEEEYAAILRRGTFADVTLTFRVKDGGVQGEVDVTVTRHYHKEP